MNFISTKILSERIALLGLTPFLTRIPLGVKPLQGKKSKETEKLNHKPSTINGIAYQTYCGVKGYIEVKQVLKNSYNFNNNNKERVLTSNSE